MLIKFNNDDIHAGDSDTEGKLQLIIASANIGSSDFIIIMKIHARKLSVSKKTKEKKIHARSYHFWARTTKNN